MNYDNYWHTPMRSQMRHDYAHCGWVYQCKANRLLRIAQAVGCILCFAAIGVMLAYRG